MGNPVFSIIWLIILILFAWWFAGFVAWCYIVVIVFLPCIPALQDLADILLKCVQFPLYCSKAIMEGKGFP